MDYSYEEIVEFEKEYIEIIKPTEKSVKNLLENIKNNKKAYSVIFSKLASLIKK